MENSETTTVKSLRNSLLRIALSRKGIAVYEYKFSLKENCYCFPSAEMRPGFFIPFCRNREKNFEKIGVF